MSDDETADTANEPYSKEYHKAKRAKLDTKSKTALDDALHDDAAVDFFDYLDKTPGAAKPAEPLKILSVRSLADNDSTSNSSSSVTTGGGVGEENVRDHLRDVKTFGIAKGFDAAKNRQKTIGNQRRFTTGTKITEAATKNDDKKKKKATVVAPSTSKLKALRRTFDEAFSYKSRLLRDGVVETTRSSSRNTKKTIRYITDGRSSSAVGEEEEAEDDEEEEQEGDDEEPLNANKDDNDDDEDEEDDKQRKKMVTPPPPSTQTGRSSRRKTAHITVANDEIEFVTDEVEDKPDGAKKKRRSQQATKKDDGGQKSAVDVSATVVKKPSSSSSSSPPNPNEELIKKVAFLRCCVNYMMTDLGRQPYSFHRLVNVNLKYLRTRYQHNKIP